MLWVLVFLAVFAWFLEGLPALVWLVVRTLTCRSFPLTVLALPGGDAVVAAVEQVS